MSTDIDELEREIAELQAKRKEIIQEKRAEVLAHTLRQVERYGFTAAELQLEVAARANKPKGSQKVKKPVTYRDESDPANILEWGGDVNQKGRKPKWISDRIANNTIEKFRVQR